MNIKEQIAKGIVMIRLAVFWRVCKGKQAQTEQS